MGIDINKVKILMAENDMNQNDLAAKADLSQTQVSRILGNRKNKSNCTPTLKTVKKIADALEVKIKEIVK